MGSSWYDYIDNSVVDYFLVHPVYIGFFTYLL